MNPYDDGGSGGTCSVKHCYNSQKKLFAINNRSCLVHPFQLQRDCSCPPPFQYHVPKNATQREIWVSKLRLTNPPKRLKVCSHHFVDREPTENNPLPQLYVGFSERERNILVRTAEVSNCCFKISKTRKRKVPPTSDVSLKRSRSNLDLEEDEQAATPHMQSSIVGPPELWSCEPGAGDGNFELPLHAVTLDTPATPHMQSSTVIRPVGPPELWSCEHGAGDGNFELPLHAVTLDTPATPHMQSSIVGPPELWSCEPASGDGNFELPLHAVTLDTPATPLQCSRMDSRGIQAVPVHAVVSDNQLSSSAAGNPHVKSATKNASCQWVDPGHHDYDKRSRTCFGDADTDSVPTSAKSDVVHVAVQCTIKEDLGVTVHTVRTDSDAKLYTGIGKVAFEAVVSSLTPFSNRCFKMHIADQILLTLMKLRLNLLFADLGRRFCISEGLASRIFSFWIDTMAFHFSQLLVWLPRETLRARMPKCFMDSKFSKTTCILDCAETFMEKPFNLESRAETYSSYKSHNTLKYLVSISPNGLIMFISAAYGGRASDRFIVQDSGILNRILPGDEILADRGFTIEDLLFMRQAKLNIPAFTQGKQLSEQDVTSTRRLANVRIHVERAIRRLKVFKILKDTAPVSMVKKFDKILIICAGLVNLKESIIRDQ